MYIADTICIAYKNLKKGSLRTWLTAFSIAIGVASVVLIISLTVSGQNVLTKELDKLGINVPMCGACLSNMAIAPDGTVVPCQSWLGTDSGLGNILTDPFNRIWKHPMCKSLRNMSEKKALDCPFRAQKGGAKE